MRGTVVCLSLFFFVLLLFDECFYFILLHPHELKLYRVFFLVHPTSRDVIKIVLQFRRRNCCLFSFGSPTKWNIYRAFFSSPNFLHAMKNLIMRLFSSPNFTLLLFCLSFDQMYFIEASNHASFSFTQLFFHAHAEKYIFDSSLGAPCYFFTLVRAHYPKQSCTWRHPVSLLSAAIGASSFAFRLFSSNKKQPVSNFWKNKEIATHAKKNKISIHNLKKWRRIAVLLPPLTHILLVE